MIRNLLFDWSGTLADDLGPVWRATNLIFEEYGRDPLSLEDFRRHFRLPFSGFYAEFLPAATEEGLEALYERFFAGLNDEVTLLPGAREILDYGRERGLRLFLLSTIKASHFERQAARLGVADAFEIAYVQINDKREKIRHLLAEHQLLPSETAFVGDMVHDIETAHYGGVLSIAVLTGFDSWEKLAPAQPDIVAQNLDALRRILP